MIRNDKDKNPKPNPTNAIHTTEKKRRPIPPVLIAVANQLCSPWLTLLTINSNVSCFSSFASSYVLGDKFVDGRRIKPTEIKA
ncbi:hypothetical protein CFP56_008473 [Quercus suber]|uniref:Uncharacterized protein n=1 Tax=Quercus suber TaxID=58331 RepID=A0AAW0L4Y3_QUESU